jgi:fumarate reductase subunit D
MRVMILPLIILIIPSGTPCGLMISTNEYSLFVLSAAKPLLFKLQVIVTLLMNFYVVYVTLWSSGFILHNCNFERGPELFDIRIGLRMRLGGTVDRILVLKKNVRKC